ncbi:hypothetical protein [Brucella pituitosa]|uniref:hypothetical protein n=1 Tax=Brucella pituitosa TaxID=571256 RepID=UPI003F4AB059
MTVDPFRTFRSDSDLHPQFLKTRDDPFMAPARAVLREVASTMADPDGNLVEQFQTHGFDNRTFEIYLHALFTEAGHAIDRTHDRPDFLISRAGVQAAVEAVTANPPPTKAYQPYNLMPTTIPSTPEAVISHLKNEVAIKFGSPLNSKLKKKYWELPHVAGLPLVIAIQTFHSGSLGLSSTSVSQFLFGIDHRHQFDNDGYVVVVGDNVVEHIGSKTIPSNFFSWPGAENISAVLFCNAGTIPKFGRVGQQGRHRSKAVRMVRYGTCFDHDPKAVEPEQFAYEVGAIGAPVEPWRDGAVLIHNPHALLPLPPEWLGASAEENLQPNGTVVPTWKDPFLPYQSLTMLFPASVSDDYMWAQIDRQMVMRQRAQELAATWR